MGWGSEVEGGNKPSLNENLDMLCVVEIQSCSS